MATFQKAAALILDVEGGDNESNLGNDYGGRTKYGISERQYPNVDIVNLTPQQASNILESDYWNRYRCGDIQDQTLANQAFLLVVNMNPIEAVQIIQKAINACGRGVINVKADGIMGSATIQAINSLSAFWLSDRIRLEAVRHYLAETDHNAKQIPNFRGWVRRALS